MNFHTVHFLKWYCNLWICKTIFVYKNRNSWQHWLLYNCMCDRLWLDGLDDHCEVFIHYVCKWCFCQKLENMRVFQFDEKLYSPNFSDILTQISKIETNSYFWIANLYVIFKFIQTLIFIFLCSKCKD